jgi:hypothetical protein
MPPEKFEQLVDELTRFAEKNPQAYRYGIRYGYFLLLSQLF